MSRITSVIHPLWRIVRTGLFALAILLLISVVIFSPSSPSVIRDGVQAASIAPRLSDSDLKHYAAAFEAVNAAEYKTLNHLFASLHNPLLKGHVLASKYLNTTYNTSRAELTKWLSAYADHPQAERIAALSLRKGTNLQLANHRSARLKGRGYAEHLGRTTAPRAWFKGLKSWRNMDYASAQKYFLRVANESNAREWHRAAGFFWAARTARKLHDTNKEARYIASAANYPDTLYGALAQHKMGEYEYMYVSVPDASRDLYESAAVMRARALAAIGQKPLAEKELRQLTMALAREERPVMIRLAAEMGLANLQMRLQTLAGLSAGEKRMAAYPMPSQIVFGAHHIDPAIVLAVVKHESAFNPNAGSETGARGLMQLMPNTANAILRDKAFKTMLASNGVNHLPIHPISDPMFNVRLGTHYLKKLRSLPHIGNSLIHVLAAYNAGPGNVRSWHKRAKHIRDPLLFIESIPFPETRNYVLQSVHHQAVYQQLLGKKATTFDALTRGLFPQFDLSS